MYHVAAPYRSIVLSVNEPPRQQSPKHGGITPSQPESPVILQPQEHPPLRIRRRILGVDGAGFCTWSPRRRGPRRGPGRLRDEEHGGGEQDVVVSRWMAWGRW